MPVLNPRQGRQPRDWRYAYDALQKFKEAARRFKIEPRAWHIIVPGKLKGMADPRWQLQFVNVDGQLTTIFIGSNGRDAGKYIDQIRRHYIEIMNRRQAQSRDPRVLQRKDPRYRPEAITAMRRKWDEMKKARSIKEWEANVKANPEVVAFMRARAGFLGMSMEDYLYRHPLSNTWPTPPTTEEQLRNRIREAEKMERDREQAQRDRYEYDNHEVKDTGPGWMG